MPGPEQTDTIQTAHAFAPALQAALAGTLGLEVNARIGGEAHPSPGDLIWEQRFEGIPDATVWVAAPESVWNEIGGAVLKEAGLDPDPAESRSTYLEVLSQAFSGFAQAAARIQGGAIDSVSGREHTDVPSEPRWTAIEIQLADQILTPLAAAFSPVWSQLGAPPQRSLPPPKPSVAVDPPADGHRRTFDLLLDVELPVSVSFGRAQLPLKDVIKLTTGSIVELNRSVSQPVEIIINNCVIARGEVVVIEGNYGVRIAQIISRQDRLRTLR